MTTANRTYWRDCEIHGTVEMPNSGYIDGGLAFCFDCKDEGLVTLHDKFTAKARIITITPNANTDIEINKLCDSRCLNGKHSCNCHCKGACHGKLNCNPDLH